VVGSWAVKYLKMKVAMSEGGIGWVAMLIDRLDNIVDRSGYGLEGFDGMRPADVLRRNFWFCTLDDPSTIDTRHTIGVDNIMVEVDYPHGDGTWPDTQGAREYQGHLPPTSSGNPQNAARTATHSRRVACHDGPHREGRRVRTGRPRDAPGQGARRPRSATLRARLSDRS
jgi:hypothetical protein